MTLSTRAEDTRHLLYNELAATGTLPSRSALAERLGIATRSFGFSVMGPDTLWWGGCAWDAFAIPNLVPDSPSVLVATTCPACNAPHACENQLIFCSLTCVSDRLQRTGNPRGYVMTLATLWRLAEHWYDGRLDTPYERRDPPLAADYFRRAGLTGGFWGLSDIPQTR